MIERRCRFCNGPLEHRFADLGSTPLANAYLTADQLVSPEPRYPLRTFVCSKCWLVQADAHVSPEEIFSHYAYYSSYSDSWVEHARKFVLEVRERFALTASSQVVEVASNDGYLLRHFMDVGVPVLGIEPAKNVAEAARTIGVPTECAFFGKAVAQELVQRGYSADLVVANNVLAHVPNINDFVGGLSKILKPDGVVSVEFPHLLQLIKDTQFDTIYHEHFYYISLLAVERIFEQHGLFVFDVQWLSTHGGSLRVLAAHADSDVHEIAPGLARTRAAEAAFGLDRIETYSDFQSRIAPVKEKLLSFLWEAKRNGKKVVAYGAAAKGNTLLNFCNISNDLIEYVVDRNPHKQGRFLPGSRLPIYKPETLDQTQPDYVLILPWNLKNEVVSAHGRIRTWGGRFAVAVPELTVL